MSSALLTNEQVDSLLTLDQFEALAASRLSAMAYEYVRGGVADGLTVTANRRAFERSGILPRVLRDVSSLDTSLTLFGEKLEFPILLAPTGYHKLCHAEGELATVRGANTSGATLIASTFSTTSFEDMSAASTRPLWFQLYMQPDRGITREMVARVVAAGCRALCLTVDVPVNGPRDGETDKPFCLPPGLERANLTPFNSQLAQAAHRPKGREIYTPIRAANVTWRDVEWLRSQSSLPLLLKGVLHPDDAATAVDCGCAGLLVSNHGGRSLDTVPATLDVLPRVAEAVAGRVPLLLDGGVRRGTDVFKALAMGAAAILIGRPYLYGLAIAGDSGVARCVDILRTELEMTMALAGCATLGEIRTENLCQLHESCSFSRRNVI